jgi:hypothetical protein
MASKYNHTLEKHDHRLRVGPRRAPSGMARDVYRFLSTPLEQKARGAGNKRHFFGEGWGVNLARWLNAENPPELGKSTATSRRRVLDLICNIHNMLVAIADAPSSDLFNHPTRRMERLQRELNSRLSEYPTTAIFSFDKGRTWEFEYGAIAGKYPDGESLAVHSLIQLAQAQLFYRIRWCECSRWFVARFAHQHFCSQRCRKRHHEKSDEYKAGRRDYMRRYYRLKNSGKVK